MKQFNIKIDNINFKIFYEKDKGICVTKNDILLIDIIRLFHRLFTK